MPPTHFEYEHPATPQDTVNAIAGRMNLPADDLLVWFDATHSGSDLSTASPILAGFYPIDDIGECVFPETVKARMIRDGYGMLIWVGSGAIEEDAVRFAVTLTHELRHVEQYLHDPQLHYANVGIYDFHLLTALLRRASRFNRWDSPTELDAEARAREIAASLLGESEVSEYYQRVCRESEALRPFVHPVPVNTLEEVMAFVRQWLTTHYNEIVKVRRAAAAPEFETHLARIRWDLFGLPGYPRHEIP